MNIYSFTVGPFAENTYLLHAGEDAVLIDPGFYEDSEYESVRTKLDELNAGIGGILLTHAHVDHVLGLQRVKEDFDVPVFLNDSDDYLWNNYASQARMFGLRVEPFGFTPEPLPAGENWKFGGLTFDVLYTPGHAPDHVALYLEDENILIAGDTLFKRGIGRTDLYKGDFNRLESSIREKLYTLPESTEVYPGHGPKTSIGYEKKNNPFVKG